MHVPAPNPLRNSGPSTGLRTFTTARLSVGWFLVCLALGCSGSAKPPDTNAPPATVKWEAPLQSNLEEWTELAGTTVPLPDRVARVSAPVEGRVLSVFGDSGS